VHLVVKVPRISRLIVLRRMICAVEWAALGGWISFTSSKSLTIMVMVMAMAMGIPGLLLLSAAVPSNRSSAHRAYSINLSRFCSK